MIPFGKYLLLERIAVGGMAEVFVGKSFGIEGFEKILAIKRILPTMAEDDDFIEMFIDEAKIAGHLSHANIVPIYELGKIGESHYIAMEFVWGKDMLQIMNRFRRLRKRMPPAMVAIIAAKICEGLDYAHNKRDRQSQPLNLIHRDVSPQNILVSYEGQVKLIDFGIARAASRTTKTQAGVLKGKFGYMSPEQVRGLPIDCRSDLFALGTCMYEMLTSERLFMGESDFTTLEKVRNADVRPPSTVVPIPPELDDIIMRALCREPGDRWQSAADLQRALQQFLVSQRPPFTTSKLAAWMKTAFSTEMTEEKSRLDYYAQIGRPSVLGAGPSPRRAGAKPVTAPPPQSPGPPVAEMPPRVPRPVPVPRQTPNQETAELRADDYALGDDAIQGEATTVGMSPFDEASAASHGSGVEELPEEPTTIFFTADDLLEEVVEELPPARPARQQPAVVLRGPSQRPPPARGGAKRTLMGVGQLGAPPPVAAAVQAPPHAQPAPPAPAPLPLPAARPAPAPTMPMMAPPPQAAALAMPPPASQPLVDPFDAPAPPPPMPPQPTPITSGAGAPVHPAQAQTMTLDTARGGSGKGKLFAILAAAIVLLAALGGGLVFLLAADSVGTIEIRTVPAVAATVKVDGVERGTTPVRIEQVPAGSRELELVAEGYASVTRTIEVGEGTTAMLDIAMMPAAASEPIALAGTPPSTGGDPPAGSPDPPAPPEPEATPEPDPPPPEAQPENDLDRELAARQAREEQEQREREQRQAEREAERTRRQAERQAQQARAPTPPPRTPTTPPVRATPMEDPPPRSSGGYGTLTIQTIPWARVILDGRDTGRNTPVINMRVPAGPHRIGLRTSDGQTHQASVTVQANQPARVIRNFTN